MIRREKFILNMQPKEYKILLKQTIEDLENFKKKLDKKQDIWAKKTPKSPRIGKLWWKIILGISILSPEKSNKIFL